MDSDYTKIAKTTQDFLIELVGNKKKVLELEPIDDHVKKILIEKNCHFLTIKLNSQLNQTNEYSQELSVRNLGESKLKEKLASKRFDVILISDSLGYFKDPTFILKTLKDFLEKDGYIVCHASNVSHGSIRLKLLDGDFKYTKTGLLSKDNLKFFTLDTILSILSSAGYSMKNLCRVKTELIADNDENPKPSLIPKELFDSILRDPESTIAQYVFTAIPAINSVDYEWLTRYPKNYVTNDLKNRIDDLKKQIPNYKQEINSLKTQNENLQNQLNKIKKSFTWKSLRKLDKLITKKNSETKK